MSRSHPYYHHKIRQVPQMTGIEYSSITLTRLKVILYNFNDPTFHLKIPLILFRTLPMDNLLGPMTQAELDLFHESRHKPMDVVDEAIFDPTSRLYYLLQNGSHNDRTALPLAIYHSMTGTTCCYDKQLKQLFFVCLSYCPSNTMYAISNEPDIPHYVSNTTSIPYPPVPSLAHAADIPPSSKRSSMNSNDVQTTLPTWPDQNYTPDARFTTFSLAMLRTIEHNHTLNHLHLNQMNQSLPHLN